MKRLMLLLMASLLIGGVGCRTDRPPEHMMIEMAFFKCEKCQSLEGGVYGKGPFTSLHTPEARKCVHDWRRISAEELNVLAKRWQGVDLEQWRRN